MPPGWYDDPHAYGWLRYWDGTAWTRETAPRPAAYSAPQPVPQQTSAYASFWARLGAYVLDLLIVVIPIEVIVLAVWMPANWDVVAGLSDDFAAGKPGAFTQIMEAESGPILIITLILGPAWFAYQYLTVRAWSATAGMRVVGIQVADAAGGRVGARSAAVRAGILGGVQLLGAVPVFGAMVTMAFVVDCLSMNWDPRRRTWHDRAAGTVVVKRARLRASPQ